MRPEPVEEDMDDDHPPDSTGYTLEMISPGHFRARLPSADYGDLLAGGQRVEVAMVVQRTPDWVLLQTRNHYPPGVFRLPLGRVGAGESPEEAARRELHEEANLVVGEIRHLFTLEYCLDEVSGDLRTEVYLITSPEGSLQPNQPSDAINAWREASLADLALLAREHERLDGEWRGWGLYRAALHRAAARVMCPDCPTE